MSKPSFGFLVQEAKMFFSHRIMIVVWILTLAFAFIPMVDIIEVINGYSPRYDYYENREIFYDGVQVEQSNAMFYYLSNLEDARESLVQDEANLPEGVFPLAIELLDWEREYFGKMSLNKPDYSSFRMRLFWDRQTYVAESFIMSHMDNPAIKTLFTETLRDRYLANVEYYSSSEFDAKFVNLTPADRAEKIATLSAEQDMTERLLSTDDGIAIGAYIEINRVNLDKEAKTIAAQLDSEREKLTLASEQAEINRLASYIRNDELRLEFMQVEREELDMRESMQVVPGDGSWQEEALRDRYNALHDICFSTIMGEEEFLSENYLVNAYGTYAAYVRDREQQMVTWQEKAQRASLSLATLQPDMRYATDGLRYRMFRNLSFSNYVFVLGAFFGSGLIASEFNAGTVRLLLVRPKTRAKILLRKYAFGLFSCIAAYLLGTLAFMLVYGAIHGFGDLAYPLYEIAGPVGFLSFYLPSLVECTLTFAFGFTLAFFFSTTVRNVAIAIVVPLMLHVASVLVNIIAIYDSVPAWLKYTPLPYMNVYLTLSGMTNNFNNRADLVSFGSCLAVLGLGSALLLWLSYLSFSRRDIDN